MFHIWEMLRYFKRSEFSNPDAMQTELLLKLDWARHLAETPFIVTSSFRARDNRTHGHGMAADIACKDSAQRLAIIRSALAVGFDRIGIYPDHIHLDISISDPRGIWWGNYPKEANNALRKTTHEEAPLTKNIPKWRTPSTPEK
jgi:hypothetical protein